MPFGQDRFHDAFGNRINPGQFFIGGGSGGAPAPPKPQPLPPMNTPVPQPPPPPVVIPPPAVTSDDSAQAAQDQQQAAARKKGIRSTLIAGDTGGPGGTNSATGSGSLLG